MLRRRSILLALAFASLLLITGGAAFHDNKVWVKKADTDAIPTP